MAQATTKVPEFTLLAAADSFGRHLKAANRAERTRQSYREAVELLDRHLASVGRPRDVSSVTRADMEAFIVSLQDAGYAPATVANRFRSLRAFWNWLAREEEVARSPMATMPVPAVPEQPVPLLAPAQVQALLATCEGTSFDERRDLALLRVLIDTGLRRNECAGLRLEDVSFDREELWVERGKGGRPRPVPIHAKTVRALDRYLRLRPRHAHHREEALWLGKRGPLGANGIERMVRRRGAEAGIDGLHPHALRHLAAHNDADDHLSTQDMMRKYGWRDPAMALRYGSAAATQRALAHAKALRGGDRY